MVHPLKAYPGLNLDTADAVLQDINNCLLPWVQLANAMHRYVEVSTLVGVSPYATTATKTLLQQIALYVESNSVRINERLERDSYNASR